MTERRRMGWDYWSLGVTPQSIGVAVAALVGVFFAFWNAADQEWKKAEASKKANAMYEAQQVTLQATQDALALLTANQQQLQATRDAAEAKRLAEEADQIERDRRTTILQGLRRFYIMSHDGISSELMAGVAWPPDDWMNAELKKQGETWTVQSTGPTIVWTP